MNTNIQNRKIKQAILPEYGEMVNVRTLTMPSGTQLIKKVIPVRGEYGWFTFENQTMTLIIRGFT